MPKIFTTTKVEAKEKKPSAAAAKVDEDLDSSNKNAVQSILRKSRLSLISALLKAEGTVKAPEEVIWGSKSCKYGEHKVLD